MKILSRVSIAFVFCLTFFAVSFVTPALAQTNTTPLSNFSTADINPNVPHNIHSLSQIVTTEVASTLLCQLAGIDTTGTNQGCLGVDPKTHQIGFLKPGNGGVVAIAFSGIQSELNIPIHSSDYVHYMASKFGVVQHAYAQPVTTGGIGFIGLAPLLGLWVAFRNIVYLFFVIIFVLVGIAIMLRVQIDPRTVMTLENQLPKIVVGLLLVTFSYAIVGFLIDIMWLLTFLVINVLTSADPVATTGSANSLTNVATTKVLEGPLQYVDDIMKSNWASGVWDLSGSAVKVTAEFLHNWWTGDTMQKIGISPQSPDTSTGCSWWQQGLAAMFPPAGLGCAVASISGDLAKTLTGAIAWIIGYILGALAGLVIVIALLITLFKVWFMLLQAYAYIILDLILAPFHIGAGLIPGSNIGFGSWLRGICANLLVFPTVVFMFVLSRVMLDTFYGSANAVAGAGGGSLFTPPLIGAVVGSGTDNPIGAFLALAIIFATPSVLGIVKKALGVEDNGMGAAALAGIGGGFKTSGGVIKRTANLSTAYKIDPLHASASQRVLSSIFR